MKVRTQEDAAEILAHLLNAMNATFPRSMVRTPALRVLRVQNACNGSPNGPDFRHINGFPFVVGAARTSIRLLLIITSSSFMLNTSLRIAVNVRPSRNVRVAAKIYIRERICCALCRSFASSCSFNSVFPFPLTWSTNLLCPVPPSSASWIAP